MPTAVITGPLTLLVVSGSTKPVGKVTLAVLDNVPLAGAVPVTVKVTAPPAGRLAIVAATVLPAATTGQLAPPKAAPQVVVTAVNAAGTASLMTVPLAAAGPALDTVMV